MSDIPKPDISPAFTLDDIRKIRDWNHERRKTMTPQAFREERRRRAEEFLAQLAVPVDSAIATEVKRRREAVFKKAKADNE